MAIDHQGCAGRLSDIAVASDEALVLSATLRLLNPKNSGYLAHYTERVFAEAKERELWERVLVEAAKQRLGVEVE